MNLLNDAAGNECPLLAGFIRYHGVWDTDELYDLNTDPHERTNLIADPAQAERVAKMNAALFEAL
jgi:N-acetylglucosamine-6-sulfatase